MQGGRGGVPQKRDQASPPLPVDMASKADAAAVDVLAQTVAGKASADSMVALSQALAGKADAQAITVLTNLLAGKADASALAALSTLVAGKALSTDLAAAIVRVAALEGVQATYATAAALTAAVTRIATLEGLLAMVPQFISTSTMTVENLLANFPAAAGLRGKYVRVSNFGGYVDRVLRCDFDANLNYHFWTPTQPEYGRSIAVTGNVTLLRLLSPQSIVLTGSILTGVTRNVTIDLANARPGEIIEIKAGLSSLLGALNILGTGLGTGVAILLGGYQKFLVDGSSGALQLVRLV